MNEVLWLAGSVSEKQEEETSAQKEVVLQDELYSMVYTGYDCLDQLTGGIEKGDFVLVCGWPGHGKSAFCLNILLNAAKARKKVAFIGLEKNREQYLNSLVSIQGNIPAICVRGAWFNDDYLKRFEEAIDTLTRDNMFEIYMENDKFELEDICRSITEARVEDGIQLVVIDHLALINVESDHYETAEQRLYAIGRRLKQLARELDIPIVAVHSLARPRDIKQCIQPETNYHEGVGNLTHSALKTKSVYIGEIEVFADIVLMLYREELVDEKPTRERVLDVYIIKNHGPQGSVGMYFDELSMQIHDFSVVNIHEEGK